MQGDDPPYLPVGTAVSAKYKGAFCEAKVSKVVRCVKCKITFKMGLGTATVTDEQVRGPLRVGHTVQARHSEKKEFIEATITKIQDCSQYTVVFDDGDITTLRRTALCLKSGRHFNESETLDQLPLTHPEHFGNPVVGGRRGRRSRQLKEDSSEGEGEEVTEPDLDLYSSDIGKVVCVEGNDKKKSRDNWFPGLVVVPSAQPTVRINVREEYLVRSFKDGRYYTVPKKEISEFSRDMGARVESPALTEAMEKAIKYLDRDELPVHWERGTLFDLQVPESDSDENFSDSSDDEPREEKDHFVAQLYKFMDDRGTPLNKSPMIAGRDVDLYRLFRVVQKLGGYNRVTNQTKWRSVTIRLGYPHNHATYNSVKQAYKKFLFSFEEFYRKLGCTMINHPRNAKKHRGRSLIRDRDRATPVNNSSPRPDEPIVEPSPAPAPLVVEKKEEPEKQETPKRVEKVKTTDAVKTKVPVEREPEEKQPVKKEPVVEATDTSSSSSECTVDTQSDSSTATKQKEEPKKKTESKQTRDKKVKSASGDKVKALVEQFEEHTKKEKECKKEEDDKVQQTRSKSQAPSKSKEQTSPDRKDTPSKSTKIQKKQQQQQQQQPQQPPQQQQQQPQEEDKKRGRKRKDTDTTENNKVSSETTTDPTSSTQPVNVGDKLKVYYGPTHESKVTYEAKVLEIDRDSTGIIYLVHYTGWNTRYDEWIKPGRIAENLSLTTKAKRLKHAQQTPGKQSSGQKPAAKRGRGTSVSSRSQDAAAPPPPPRSTTPSSVTSSSSRTKSPATPVSKSSSSRVTRHGESSSGSGGTSRRTRRNTDFSIASDTDSDQSESESELSRTRSGCKSEEQQVTKKKPPPPSKRKDDDDTEKEDDDKPKRMRKMKKSPEKNPVIDSDDDDSCSPPKGRDFDLNQIRSELKGFEKAVKIATAESAASEASTSTSSSSNEDKPSGSEAKASSASDKKHDDKEKSSKQDKQTDKTQNTEDIYEFKEPEPFEFEARASKLSGSEDKSAKKRLVPRLFEELEKSPVKKKGAKSPPKTAIDTKDNEEKKRPFKRSPAKKVDEEEKITLLECTPPSAKTRSETSCEDPFDKLVESPSFNIGLEKKSPAMLISTDTSASGGSAATSSNKLKSVNALNMDETLSLFRELPETVGDDSRDRLDISDTDDIQTDPPLFTHKEPIFSDFNKPETSSIFRGFTGKCDSSDDKKRLLKDGASDEDDSITAAIQRAISNTMTDEESTEDDLFITQPTSIYQPKLKPKDEPKHTIIVSSAVAGVILPVPNATVKQEDVKEPLSINTQSKESKENTSSSSSSSRENHSRTPKQISPALQETDSSLLEAISLKTEMLKKEEPREPQIKTGTKIADSILQKFNMIKKNEEIKPVKVEPKVEKIEAPVVVQPMLPVIVNTVEVVKEEKVVKEAVKEEKPAEVREVMIKEELPEPPPTPQQQPVIKIQQPVPQIQLQITETEYPMNETKKRPSKKFVSREFIDESDDSSDSEERLVIARSDDDSQTVPSDDKPDFKDTDSNTSAVHAHTDDSQEDERNFKLESIIKVGSVLPDSTTVDVVQTDVKVEQVDAAKQADDEPDSNISLLLCKETIPGSPAPVPEVSPAPAEPRIKPKSAKSLLLEMPFASAPGSSNSKAMLTATNPSHESKQLNAKQQHLDAQPLALPLAMDQACDGNETNTVIDNTPPTTPESTMSNMSPRGEPGRISPNTADNESCKSTDSGHRAQSSKIAHYSEEDTIMTSEACLAPKKVSRGVDDMPASCRKRRRSCKPLDELPPKRGRRANVRNVRANSDSDDTSEHSAPGSTPPASVLVHQAAASITIETRSSSRSPRPRKYNFVIELDPSLDCGQRISMLQQKLSELRKTYNNVKTELACIDRRRKKLRRREREAMKAAKQEMACS